MKTYNLHIGNVHLLNEALVEKRGKRNILIGENTLEELDRKTALFPSFKELEEELNEVQGPNDVAVIMLLDDYNNGIRIVTSDIVYTKDKKEIDNRDSIRLWTIEHLKKYPIDIKEFDGIKEVYKNIYGNKDREYSEQKIVNASRAYFNSAGYKAYRDTYFVLKSLTPEIERKIKR